MERNSYTPTAEQQGLMTAVDEVSFEGIVLSDYYRESVNLLDVVDHILVAEKGDVDGLRAEIMYAKEVLAIAHERLTKVRMYMDGESPRMIGAGIEGMRQVG